MSEDEFEDEVEVEDEDEVEASKLFALYSMSFIKSILKSVKKSISLKYISQTDGLQQTYFKKETCLPNYR